ncbi:serine hydrolase domain-containing protein [Alteromonas sp. ASW11-130]|uniref:serine hydrolase domain-containing protein n=1 Tax=Alteromonas sp. ASW11-130 TaxID=3015775 RepID=UPI0022428EE6|nr:serine hydrolase domain-containing protein [Alteromonas sp. ASW11-130]MCW8092731.1 beta-lactamase family protein [Alteromonas sp. ASW11-130]
MKKTSFIHPTFALWALLCLTAFISPLQAGSLAQPAASEIKSQMKQWQQQYQLPSLSLAISLDDKVVFADAVGFADIESKKKASVQTQYSVGSLAKPMTGLAVARLIDSNKLHIDNSVADYLTDYPQYNQISIKQLASHTAGISRPWEERNNREFESPRDHASPFESIGLVSDKPLKFTPGTSFQYTSMGYVVLSAVIETTAQQPYTDYMTKQVFAPLGMHSTVLDDSSAGKQSEATYYSKKIDESTFELAVSKRDRSFLFGGGGYISSPSDLVKMAKAFSGSHFISEDTQSLLLTPVKMNNGEINPQGYSIGWRVKQIEDPIIENKKVTVIHHGGITHKASTAFIVIIPEYRAALAYATNTDPKDFWKAREESIALLFKLYHAKHSLSENTREPL